MLYTHPDLKIALGWFQERENVRTSSNEIGPPSVDFLGVAPPASDAKQRTIVLKARGP